MTLQSNSAGLVESVILPNTRDIGDFKVRRALPSAERRMVGPFIFFDAFGPAVFRAGEGIDVRLHPHIGLATLTYLIEGEILHRDSTGESRAIRPGDVNWMTAGRGIVHSERTDADARARGGSLFGQQIWIALPRAHEETDPSFSHHAGKTLPLIEAEGISMKLITGTGFGATAPVPIYSDMIYADVLLASQARFEIAADHEERAIYVVSGAVSVEGQEGAFTANQLVVFKPGADILLKATAETRVMLLGGAPLPEPRHIFWNFVSSSLDRIEQAKADWRDGRFAGVPGETEFIPLPAET
jgi:redox-sensitive bicupin YhaK (pirin superfamily)